MKRRRIPPALRSWVLAGSLAALWPAAALAGAEIALELEHRAVLQHEPLRACVTVRNTGSTPVILGGTGADMTLDFTIERDPDVWVSRRDQTPYAEYVLIDPVKTRQVVLDLTRWFNLSSQGRYFIRATVTEGKKTVRSRPQMVDIVPGIELVELRRPIAGKPERERLYSLRYWRRGRYEILFLRVSDVDSGLAFTTVRLGRLLRVTTPTMTLSPEGELRIRHQSSTRQTTESVLESNVSGLRLLSQESDEILVTAPPITRPAVPVPGSNRRAPRRAP